MVKKIIFTVLMLGAIGVGIGLYMYNKPLDDIQSMSTDFALTSDALLNSFEEDEDEANTKYLDKVIEVSGKVSKTENENGKTSIYLTTENDLSNVIFQLENEDASIKEGQVVTMKGVCTGYLMDVVLVRAIKI